MARIVDSKLIITGCIYLCCRCRPSGIRTYWDHQKVRAGECTARAITAAVATEERIVVIRGRVESSHIHPPQPRAMQSRGGVNLGEKRSRRTP